MAYVKRFTSWSFSRYSDYKQCPAKAKYKHLDKLAEPPNDAMRRGSDIHKLAEQYIKGLIPKLPKELHLFKSTFEVLKKRFKKRTLLTVVEDSWAFTKDWIQTKWDDWANCWLRIKLDLAYEIVDGVMIITDWKTGKFRPDQNEAYLEQLQLYVIPAFLLYPHLKEVRPQLVYLDTGDIFPPDDDPLVYTPEDVPKLQAVWAKRTKAMLNDTKFAPRPNDKCRWCHYRKDNGGPCKF